VNIAGGVISILQVTKGEEDGGDLAGGKFLRLYGRAFFDVGVFQEIHDYDLVSGKAHGGW